MQVGHKHATEGFRLQCNNVARKVEGKAAVLSDPYKTSDISKFFLVQITLAQCDFCLVLF